MAVSSTSFKPGQSGNPAGRKPGSKNKRTQKIEEKCQEMGFDPIEFLIGVAKNESNDMNYRLKAACEINSCLNPKKKAIAHEESLNLDDYVSSYTDEEFDHIINCYFQSRGLKVVPDLERIEEDKEIEEILNKLLNTHINGPPPDN